MYIVPFDNYILAEDGKTPIKADWDQYVAWVKKDGPSQEIRRVGADKVGDVTISTVFLSHDHAFNGGPPVLWETMIFGGEHDQFQDRYTSHEDAVAGHARALAMVKGEVGL